MKPTWCVKSVTKSFKLTLYKLIIVINKAVKTSDFPYKIIVAEQIPKILDVVWINQNASFIGKTL